MKTSKLLISSLICLLCLSAGPVSYAQKKEALKAIDPSQAEYDTTPPAPPTPAPSQGNNPFGNGIQGQPLGAPRRTLQNPNPSGGYYLPDNTPPPGAGSAQPGQGWNPSAQADSSGYERRVQRLEQLTFGSPYPEHDVEDRIDHLETEVFSKKNTGMPVEQRLSRLESKLLGQTAFGQSAQSPTPSAAPSSAPSTPPAQSSGARPGYNAPQYGSAPQQAPKTAWTGAAPGYPAQGTAPGFYPVTQPQFSAGQPVYPQYPAQQGYPASQPYGTAQPGTQPYGAAQQGMRPYSTTQPGMQPYGATQPGMQPYGATQAGMQPYGATQPGMQPYGATQAGMQPYGATQPGMQPWGATPPGMQPYGTAQAGMRPYGTAQAGMQPYGTAQAGMQPYGTAQAGMQPYGTAQPGMQPYGTAQPGMQPYGAAQPGMRPYGAAQQSLPPYGTAQPGMQGPAPYSTAQSGMQGAAPYSTAQPGMQGAAPYSTAQPGMQGAAPYAAPPQTISSSAPSGTLPPEVAVPGKQLGLSPSDRANADIDNIVKSIPLKPGAGDYFAGISKFPSGSVARWASFPVLVHLPQGSPANWQKTLEEAVGSWGRYIPVRTSAPSETADVEIAWINHLPPRALGQTNLEIFNGHMRVTVYLLRPSYYLANTSEKMLRRVAEHEVGHAIGIFGHSTDPADLMYPVENVGSKDSTKYSGITPRDLNTLRRIYESPALPPGFQSPHPMGWSFSAN